MQRNRNFRLEHNPDFSRCTILLNALISDIPVPLQTFISPLEPRFPTEARTIILADSTTLQHLFYLHSVWFCKKLLTSFETF